MRSAAKYIQTSELASKSRNPKAKESAKDCRWLTSKPGLAIVVAGFAERGEASKKNKRETIKKLKFKPDESKF